MPQNSSNQLPACSNSVPHVPATFPHRRKASESRGANSNFRGCPTTSRDEGGQREQRRPFLKKTPLPHALCALQNQRFSTPNAQQSNPIVPLRRLEAAESGIESIDAQISAVKEFLAWSRWPAMRPLQAQKPTARFPPSRAPNPTLSSPPIDSAGSSACTRTKEKRKIDLEFTRPQKHLARPKGKRAKREARQRRRWGTLSLTPTSAKHSKAPFFRRFRAF